METTKDTKITKGHRTIRFMPFFNKVTLKLIRKPVLILANFM